MKAYFVYNWKTPNNPGIVRHYFDPFKREDVWFLEVPGDPELLRVPTHLLSRFTFLPGEYE